MTDLSNPDADVQADQAAASEQPPPSALQTDMLSAAHPPCPVAEPMPTTIASVQETRLRWLVQDEAVVGLAHRVKNLPCQDAVQATDHPRPALVLADGAGSSAVSEIGARAVVRSTSRLLDTLDKPLSAWLDRDCPDPQQEARTWGLLLVKHAIGTLKDLAAEHRRELRDFRCTLLVAVVGRQHLFWLKIGDGAIVLENRRLQSDEQGQSSWAHDLCVLGEPGKGEFANQTQFLDGIRPDEVQIGCLPTGQVSGLALMSDGAAEKLVANDGSRVAPRVSKLLQQLREDKLRRSVLTRLFYEESFCMGTSGDDRSIALTACENPVIRNGAPPTTQVLASMPKSEEPAAAATMSASVVEPGGVGAVPPPGSRTLDLPAKSDSRAEDQARGPSLTSRKRDRKGR